MRVARIGPAGAEIPVVEAEDGTLLDAREITGDITPEFIRDGGIGELAAALPRLPRIESPVERYGAPLARTGKILCIGLNYAEHVRESGAETPSEPIVFMKAANTLSGPNDPVIVPRGSTKLDYEVELGVVIGRKAQYLDSSDQALASIAGYCVANDVSERSFQLERGGQWVKGKSCESFNPLGPWLVTADAVPDVQGLLLELDVNGEIRQTASTDDMIFGVPEIVRYLSQFFVLEPGDLICTGTPSGVALGSDDIPWLRAGDKMRLSVSGLGEQTQLVVAR